jgi:hypothetical protein
MNDLFTENVTIVKNIDNFFLEFENQFAFSFQDVDLEIYDKEIKFNSDDERFIYIEEKKLFEKYFSWMSRKIINHLLYQLEKKDGAIPMTLFLQRQIDYSSKYFPEDRKEGLINDYKIYYVAGGDDTILYEKYNYSNYEKMTLKKAFESYKIQYNKVVSKVKQLLTLLGETRSDLIEVKQKILIPNERFPLLFEKLNEMGFFALVKIKVLNENQKISIIELIKKKNNIPYTIALLHHIGFIDHLEQNVYSKKTTLYKKLSNLLNVDSSGRTIRGLINSLKPVSNENVYKYTAHIHVLDATEDFKSIIEEEI